jgi:hypothetical protein
MRKTPPIIPPPDYAGSKGTSSACLSRDGSWTDC